MIEGKQPFRIMTTIRLDLIASVSARTNCLRTILLVAVLAGRAASKKIKALFLLGDLLVLVSFVDVAHAQSTAFTYQGRLTDGASPAHRTYDLTFRLYDATVAGSPAGHPATNRAPAVVVSFGLFTVELDFGAAAFTGSARWLEIGVRTNGSSGDFTTLTPHQPITPTPYALFAGKAATLAEKVSQAFTGTMSFNPLNPVAPPFAVISAASITNA